MIIERSKEIHTLEQICNSSQAEFVAVYGRRRVGKTFLITQALNKKGTFFHVTGLKNAPLKTQLQLFTEVLSKVFYEGMPLMTSPSWLEAFALLNQALENKTTKSPVILFFDELPWFQTPKSQFVEALDYYWNRYWSLNPKIKLVVCGSAAAWMIKNLIYAKGGLHNRITKRIHLQPFDLKETHTFLTSRGINLNHKQTLDLYSVLGGVPYYLIQVEKGRSAAQVIDSLCFHKSGLLIDEYDKLLQSLFSNPDWHRKILTCLAKTQTGFSKEEIFKKSGLKSGGTGQKVLWELEESGFIHGFVPYGNKKKLTFYKIIDEYIWFYFNWILPFKKSPVIQNPENYWIKKINSPSYHNWKGYVFENICLKYSSSISRALKIQNLDFEIGSWRYIPKQKTEKGAQIDLLFDRSDGVISLCEIKYRDAEFQIDKKYAEELKNKIEVFSAHYKTKKQLFLELITTYGLKRNTWSEGLVSNVVKLDALFS